MKTHELPIVNVDELSGYSCEILLVVELDEEEKEEDETDDTADENIPRAERRPEDVDFFVVVEVEG